MKLSNLLQFLLLFVFLNCKRNNENFDNSQKNLLFYHCIEKYQDLIILDIYSPPVASRMYVYPLLAAYEASKNHQINSITNKLNGFDTMPNPGYEIESNLSTIVAFCETATKLIFSGKQLIPVENEIIEKYKANYSNSIIENSINYGKIIAQIILKRAADDNYKATRGMERFEVKTKPGLWVPTPPDYADATEPHWWKIKSLTLDSTSQFSAKLDIPYNENKSSAFFKEIEEVVEISKKLSSDQEDKIVFWDDNPFVSSQKGHLMFQDKKMTPGGHWLSICAQICKNQKYSTQQASNALAITSIAIFDAFISCWYTKYLTVRVRPETAINKLINPNWHPYLVTPPFPAFTSGHSTVSASAATVLEKIFSSNMSFIDSTEIKYNLSVRKFSSFKQAANEASESRILAGIHYKSDCVAGNIMGTNIGNFIFQRITTK